MPGSTPKRLNPNKVNLSWDFTIFIAFLVAMAPRFSGIAIHEWLSIAFGAAIIVHLLLHWQWIAEITRRLFRRVPWARRINYGLNALLFIDITIVIFTGLVISEAALPLLGVRPQAGGFWRRLHTQSADLSVFLVGLHIALHWQWVVRAVRRYLIAPLLPRRAQR